MKSIRIRLLVYVLGVLIISLTLLTIFSYREAAQEIEEVFDSELAQTARMISQLTLSNIDSKNGSVFITKKIQHDDYKYEKHINYQVWYNNALALKSESSPNVPLASTSGYSDIVIDNIRWRVFALSPQGSRYRIYTAEDYTERNEFTGEVVAESMKVFLWTLPLLAILIYISLSHALKSLTRLSDDVRLRDVNQLKPLNGESIPDEVLPLVSALNELLAKLDASILKEKRFTANASHELRTPLSGIKLHAQLALKSSTDQEQRHSLEQIIHAVDQSAQLVEQLLTLNRLESSDQSIQISKLDLVKFLRSIIAEMQPAATKFQADISLQSKQDAITVMTNREILHTVIRNLLDNAMRHNSGDKQITVILIQNENQINLEITDNGSGIPEHLLERVTQRFYRISGQDVEGSGLGLAIVSESVKAIGCELALQNNVNQNTGLTARIIFKDTSNNS